MKLSAPIYRLKHQAKTLSRTDGIPLHEALDQVATQEGFNSWSLLATQWSATAPANKLFTRFSLGDLILVGARPGQGKTQLSLEILVEAMKSGHQGFFFTLEYSETDILNLFKNIGEHLERFRDQFTFDTSNSICAEYIMNQLSTVPAGTTVVIDYLQLLDQKRENPELMDQVRMLKSFAKQRDLIIIFISQIDRFFDSSIGSCPDLKDIRLPNPLDLQLFNTACFLHDGEIQISALGEIFNQI